MSKAKLLGRVNSRRDRTSKDRIRWERQNARKEVLSHDSYLGRMFGGADEGCLQSAVTAGMKKKK